MIHNGFTLNTYDICVYHKKLMDDSFVYVDDMLIAAKNMSQVNLLKKQLGEEFGMEELSTTKKILGMKITRDSSAGKLRCLTCLI